MKKFILIILSSIFLVFADFKESDIEGLWLTSKKDGKFEIYKKNGKFHGKLVWSKTPNKKDENNPNEKLKNRKLIGCEILTNFEWNGEEYIDGEIYNPRNGKTYSCKMWLKDKNTLKVNGYVGFSFIGEERTWTRTLKKN